MTPPLSPETPRKPLSFWIAIAVGVLTPILLPLLFHRAAIARGEPLTLDMWFEFPSLGVYLFIIGSHAMRVLKNKTTRLAIWLLPPLCVLLLVLFAPKDSTFLKLIPVLVGSYIGIAIFTLLSEVAWEELILPTKK